MRDWNLRVLLRRIIQDRRFQRRSWSVRAEARPHRRGPLAPPRRRDRRHAARRVHSRLAATLRAVLSAPRYAQEAAPADGQRGSHREVVASTGDGSGQHKVNKVAPRHANSPELVCSVPWNYPVISEGSEDPGIHSYPKVGGSIPPRPMRSEKTRGHPRVGAPDSSSRSELQQLLAADHGSQGQGSCLFAGNRQNKASLAAFV